MIADYPINLYNQNFELTSPFLLNSSTPTRNNYKVLTNSKKSNSFYFNSVFKMSERIFWKS